MHIHPTKNNLLSYNGSPVSVVKKIRCFFFFKEVLFGGIQLDEGSMEVGGF